MAQYSSPPLTELAEWTGLNTHIFQQTDAELTAYLKRLLRPAEASIAVQVGADTFRGSSLTNDQVLMLQQAVAFGVAWRALFRLKTQKLSGSHAPLLVEDSEALDEAIRDYKTQEQEFAALVTTGSINTPFAMPAVSSSTFSYTSGTDRTPSERNAALDERDDLSSHDADA